MYIHIYDPTTIYVYGLSLFFSRNIENQQKYIEPFYGRFAGRFP